MSPFSGVSVEPAARARPRVLGVRSEKPLYPMRTVSTPFGAVPPSIVASLLDVSLSRDLVDGNVVQDATQPGMGGGILMLEGTVTDDTIAGNVVTDGSGNPAGSGGGVFILRG
jgi:hypothetical protein